MGRREGKKSQCKARAQQYSSITFFFFYFAHLSCAATYKVAQQYLFDVLSLKMNSGPLDDHGRRARDLIGWWRPGRFLCKRGTTVDKKIKANRGVSISAACRTRAGTYSLYRMSK